MKSKIIHFIMKSEYLMRFLIRQGGAKFSFEFEQVMELTFLIWFVEPLLSISVGLIDIKKAMMHRCVGKPGKGTEFQV
jgi:hypothetical protein